VVATASGSGFTIQMAQISGTMLQRNSGTLTFSGTNLTFTPTCPPPGDGGDQGGTQPYTATADTLTVYDMGGGNSNGQTRLQKFMKR
jgi:hypothetical protein